MMKARPVIVVMLFVTLLISGVSNAQDTNDPFLVGMLAFPFYHEPFKAQMTELGYIEGQNISYMLLTLEGDDFMQYAEQQRVQTEAMLNAPVDLLVVNTDTEAVNLRQQTDIPIVFVISDDPVVTGAVADLTVPGGNTTGIVSNRHHERRLQLLTEVIPTDSIYYLYNPIALEGETIFQRVQTIGTELGVEVIGAPAPDGPTGVETLNNAPEGVDWLFLTPYTPFDQPFYEALFALSAARSVPIANYVGTPDEFAIYVINYGPNLNIAAEQAAQIVDQIIRGASPGEIPVVIAENSLIVNLESAAMLGIEIPDAILRQANLIIRPGDIPPLPTAGA